MIDLLENDMIVRRRMNEIKGYLRRDRNETKAAATKNTAAMYFAKLEIRIPAVSMITRKSEPLNPAYPRMAWMTWQVALWASPARTGRAKARIRVVVLSHKVEDLLRRMVDRFPRIPIFLRQGTPSIKYLVGAADNLLTGLLVGGEWRIDS